MAARKKATPKILYKNRGIVGIVANSPKGVVQGIARVEKLPGTAYDTSPVVITAQSSPTQKPIVVYNEEKEGWGKLHDYSGISKAAIKKLGL